jgi:phosphoribosylformimino-5-aminoimidazole carboxamide ribotide isomerase
MIIFPAIDIKGGKCVRLLKGDFSKTTNYTQSPFEQSKEFYKLGFKNIHIIDLDGALEGKLVNKNIIKEIIEKNELKIQVGGGIRTIQDIKQWVNMGVDKVIIGTAAIQNPEFLKKACLEYKDKIALALDVREGFVALSGWKKQTNILAIDFIKKVENFGISRIIYTDINKDGTKTGSNIEDTVNISEQINIPVIISGGISSILEILDIKKMKLNNIQGVIVGKAMYDKNINIKELSKII